MEKITDIKYAVDTYRPEYVITGNIVRFVASHGEDVFSINHTGSIRASFFDVVTGAKAHLPEGTDVRFLDPLTVLLEGPGILVKIVDQGSTDIAAASADGDDDWDAEDPDINTNLWTVERRDINVTVYGGDAVLRRFYEAWVSKIHPSKTPQVQWHYMVKGERHYNTFYLPPARIVKDAYYPWIKEGIDSYVTRFLRSNNSVIILRGEAGTGKSSFIQHLIWKSGTNAMLTYEDSLFKSDDMFRHFMSSKTTNLLLMEDADLFLTGRVKDGNTTMSKFLNVSDGILHFPRKKLVISSNVIDLDKMDPALVRPGRCFDTPHFRALTYEEALEAAKMAEVEPPTVPRDYTLAEVFASRPAHTIRAGFLRGVA